MDGSTIPAGAPDARDLVADLRRDEVAMLARTTAAVQPKASAQPLALIDPRSWTTPPQPRRWVVEDYVPRGVVTALYGDGGTGKSLVAQQFLTCTALTLPWLGLPTCGGRALGIFCEDSTEELHRRQADINASLDVQPKNLENLRLLSRLGHDNLLMEFTGGHGDLTDFFAELDATCRAWRPALLVLDTAADLFGGNEIDRGQVRAFIQGCLARLARDYDAAVVLCAHPSAEGLRNGSGTGGSTAWNNTVRSRLFLTRPAPADAASNPNRRDLARMKSNYGPRDARIEIEWQAGAFVRVDDISDQQSGGLPSWAAISAMFDEMDAAWQAGRAWSFRKEARKAGRWFPAWVKAHLGVPESATEKLLADWLMNGLLAVEIFDRKAKTKGLRVLRRPDL